MRSKAALDEPMDAVMQRKSRDARAAKSNVEQLAPATARYSTLTGLSSAFFLSTSMQFDPTITKRVYIKRCDVGLVDGCCDSKEKA
jgi:hypothetical protein